MRGSPNLYMMFFHKKKKKIILLMVIFTSASTSTHLVKYSTTNKTSCVLLEAFRNGPNISISIVRKVIKRQWWLTQHKIGEAWEQTSDICHTTS